MGNGNSKRCRDLEKEVRRLQGRLQELRKKDEQISELEVIADQLRHQLKKSVIGEKDAQISKLEKEIEKQSKIIMQLNSRIDKYQSIHKSSTVLFGLGGASPRRTGISAEVASRRGGILAEPVSTKGVELRQIDKVDKSDRWVKCIRIHPSFRPSVHPGCSSTIPLFQPPIHPPMYVVHACMHVHTCMYMHTYTYTIIHTYIIHT